MPSLASPALGTSRTVRRIQRRRRDSRDSCSIFYVLCVTQTKLLLTAEWLFSFLPPGF